jgi:ribosome-associated protein
MQSSESEDTPRLSRTRKKQAARRLQALGERLVALPVEQAARVPMPAELAQAVADAREMHKHGARRRQLQYIGALMRELDPGPIERALADLTRGDRRAVRRFKQLERWRDALLDGDLAVVAEIRRTCPGVDAARIEQLVAAVRSAKAVPVRRKAARQLFRYLKDSIVTD